MYRKTVLNNGIRVITESMREVRSIAMGIIVETGLKDERPNQNGLAHLVEHLMFQGTSSRDSMQIARMMDDAGGHMGAFTARDYTCYAATVLDDYRTYALDLLGDVLLNSIFPDEAIENQKDAIIREIDGTRDFPVQRVDALMKAHAWSTHLLGRPITGNAKTVKKLMREDVIYFVHKNYLPDRIIVAAAGHLEHQDFVAQVRDAFWRLPGSSTPTASLVPEHQPGIAVEYIPVSHAYFSIGIPAFPYAHEDRYALHILNRILGGGISSRLFRSLREDTGLVYNIDSEYHAYREAGMLVIEGSTSPDHFCKVVRGVLTVIRRLFTGEQPIQADELLIAKNQIKSQHLIEAENTDTRMSRLATQELYFGHQISTEQLLKHVDAVDDRKLKEVQAVIAEDLYKITVAIVGPDGSKPYDLSVDEAIQAVLSNNYERRSQSYGN